MGCDSEWVRQTGKEQTCERQRGERQKRENNTCAERKDRATDRKAFIRERQRKGELREKSRNSKPFFAYLKEKTKCKIAVGPLNDGENNLISSNEEMAGIQKEFFAKRGMGLS
jgi:hypothetical protein